MTASLSLRALAQLVGILPGYVSQTGAYEATTDAARAKLLTALGHDVSDARAARRTLRALLEAEYERILEPVVVTVAGDAARQVRAVVREMAGEEVAWQLDVTHEGGGVVASDGRAPVARDGTLWLALAGELPLGYHTITLRVRAVDGGAERSATQRFIVVPPHCASPATVLGGERVVGVTANLYAVRSRANDGIGDASDLRTLVDLAADQGAAFVGVNPLHALRTSGAEPSPYGPVSRLFRNRLYIDLHAVPELELSDEARTTLRDPEWAAQAAALREASQVDYPAVAALKRPVLEALHRTFIAHASPERRAAYAAYRAEQGDALDRYATFSAIDEFSCARGRTWWPEWDEELRDPAGPGVAAFREVHADTVDFHRWCQFELDRQLGAVAAAAAGRGMPVGLYQDLAVGASPAGSDVWGDPELFVRGAGIGAPPDPLGPDGQNWGLPPMNPRVLRERGYADWTRLVRAALRHAGALRIDHAIGIFRQFWIPEGATGRDGAYMRFPFDDLLGILALESVRAGALVVGEDLGTVPPEVPPGMARWGLLSSKVLYFERGDDATFCPTRHYPRLALATANTHDLATLAGWWAGRDIALRREVGQIVSDEDATQARHDRARERARLVRLLADEGLVDVEAHPALVQADTLGAESLDDLAFRTAVHTLMRRAPSWMVGLALEDLVGEREPINMPGVGPAEFSSWTRRLHVDLEDLVDDPDFRRAFGAERAWPTMPRGAARVEAPAALGDDARRVDGFGP